MRPILFLVFLLVSAHTAYPQADIEKSQLGRIVWSAFQCATYAEMSGDVAEQSRLFEVGLRSGRKFIDAVKNKQITPEIMTREVPIGVTMLLQGPTPDFILGRIFENAMHDAFDEIVKNGNPYDTTKWINDTDLRKTRARTKFDNGNCAFVN